MHHVHKKFDIQGFTVEIVQDDDPQRPLDDCTPSDRGVLMLGWHRRYTLGDDEKYNRVGHLHSYSDWNEVEREIKRIYRPLVILPLAVHDHGNVHIFVGRGGGWDSGQVGFAFDYGYTCEDGELRRAVHARIDDYREKLSHAFRETQPEDEDEDEFEERLEAAVDEFAANIGNEFPQIAAVRDDIEKRITGWVEAYDDYLNGNVWGWVVESPDGDVVESCWGYSGDPGKSGVIEEGLAQAEHCVEEREAEAARCEAVMHL
jgi:SAM-dependent methyltransferase